MVRGCSLGAFCLENSTIDGSRRTFYRRDTAKARGFLPELRKSTPRSRLPGIAPDAWLRNRYGGRAAPSQTRKYGSLSSQRSQGAPAQMQRSGSEARCQREDAAPLHEGRPHPLSPPPRRARPHTRERDRRVLVRARSPAHARCQARGRDGALWQSPSPKPSTKRRAPPTDEYDLSPAALERLRAQFR
jgi:hypothetical protein